MVLDQRSHSQLIPSGNSEQMYVLPTQRWCFQHFHRGPWHPIHIINLKVNRVTQPIAIHVLTHTRAHNTLALNRSRLNANRVWIYLMNQCRRTAVVETNVDLIPLCTNHLEGRKVDPAPRRLPTMLCTSAMLITAKPGPPRPLLPRCQGGIQLGNRTFPTAAASTVLLMLLL